VIINKRKARLYLQETAPHVRQIGTDFWPALEAKVRLLIDQAVRRNRNFKRLTAGELA